MLGILTPCSGTWIRIVRYNISAFYAQWITKPESPENRVRGYARTLFSGILLNSIFVKH